MRLSASTVLLSALLAGAGCDSTPRGRDASVPGNTQRQTEVAVRVDAPNGGSPSVSVLAYRATISGIGNGGMSADEILGIVDPLVALPPESGCARRDVAGVARAVGDRGGKVELESLAGVRLDLGGGTAPLRPLPRVYPDLASAVGGVIGEAGPIDMAVAPQTLGLGDELHPPGGLGLAIELPVLPRLYDLDGSALLPNPTFSVRPDQDLELVLTGPASTFVELRPFGATWALACARTGIAGDRVIIPAADLARLADLRVPVSLEAVARETHSVVLGGSPTRLTLEVRTSSVVKLRP